MQVCEFAPAHIVVPKDSYEGAVNGFLKIKHSGAK
jgi:hypothetical protein